MVSAIIQLRALHTDYSALCMLRHLALKKLRVHCTGLLTLCACISYWCFWFCCSFIIVGGMLHYNGPTKPWIFLNLWSWTRTSHNRKSLHNSGYNPLGFREKEIKEKIVRGKISYSHLDQNLRREKEEKWRKRKRMTFHNGHFFLSRKWRERESFFPLNLNNMRELLSFLFTPFLYLFFSAFLLI